MSDDDDDDDGAQRLTRKGGPVWTEFDCPLCEANNPVGDGFQVGDEVLCLFCGVPFDVRQKDEKFRLVEA
jgi:hypothetical protein